MTTFPQPAADSFISCAFPNCSLMSCDIPNKKPPALMSLLPHPATFPFEDCAYLALNFVRDGI